MHKFFQKIFRLRNELLLRQIQKNRVEKITWLSKVSNIIQCKDTEMQSLQWLVGLISSRLSFLRKMPLVFIRPISWV